MYQVVSGGYRRGTLLQRAIAWLYQWDLRRRVARGEAVGDYVVVPPGYKASVLHKLPGVPADPLEYTETVCWKLIPRAS